jgi:mutator protein MutT
MVRDAKQLTLCFIVKDGRVLLGKKKRGFGMGKWNGFGGKIEPGETREDAARRELREESGIVARAIESRGLLRFDFDEGSGPLDVHLYAVLEHEGEPEESEEMLPRWFALEDIPFGDMWPDDMHWLPHFLAGKTIDASFRFADLDTIVHADVRTAD